jgi:hypothetical protein
LILLHRASARALAGAGAGRRLRMCGPEGEDSAFAES